jgi:thiol-disulfide isomerase/thioredoxin
VVLLDFWASWCGPCRGLFPHNRALVEKMRGRPFVLLGVNGDGDRAKLNGWLKKNPLPWRSWWDGPDGKIARQWGVTSFPTLFLLDHRGAVRRRFDGGPDPAELDREIEQLVQEARP